MSEQLLRAARQAWDRKEWGAVWKWANGALNEYPDSAEGLFLAGAALREMGNIGAAVALFRRALALRPDQIQLWMHYAATLHDLNEWDEARDAYLMVLKAAPQEPGAMANIAAGYVQQGKPADAVEWADKALALNPNSHIAHIARAFGNLGLGRWVAGWEDNVWLYGHHLPERIYKPKGQEEPMWQGVKGQTVVVTMDQGLGDHIMFAQCIRDLIRDSKQVIIECEKRMANLWKRNFPEAKVYPTLGEVQATWPANEDIDAHVPISILGRWYRKSNSDFPRKAYLTADPELVKKWREWLSQFPGPRIGIAWQGGLQRSLKHLRSFALAELEPVMLGTMIDMSYHDSAREVAQWNIAHPDKQVIKPPLGRDYEDTLALAAALDDVVTCTTTLAHACGALGRHAYVLVPEAPQWRYQARCGDGLWWYPEHSVELVRQVPGEDGWSPAIARVAKKMRGIVQLRAA